jgi:hypothetical protein
VKELTRIPVIGAEKPWLETWAAWLAILGALCGAAFALYRYVGTLEASRSKEALSYIERFSEAPISVSYGRFDKNIKEYLAKFDAKAAVSDEAMVGAFSNTELEQDALRVIQFFDNVAVCTCKNLCDEQLVAHFLGWQAKDFSDLTGPYIQDQRTKQNYPKSLASGLEALAALQRHPGAAMKCSFVTDPMI